MPPSQQGITGNKRRAIQRKWKKYRKLYVFQKNDRTFVPQTIPKERESIIIIYCYCIIIILFITAYFHINVVHGSIRNLLGLYSRIILFYFFLCLVDRTILFLVELQYQNSRYEGLKSKIFMAAFYFDIRASLLFLICLLHVVYDFANHNEDLKYTEEFFSYLIISFLYFLSKVFLLNGFPINDSLNIAKKNGLDYGSGMAYSYFYGYLNFMLSKYPGEPNKDLLEMMEDYESTNNIKFRVKKLFILLPKSFHCFSSVIDGSKIMKTRTNLLEKIISVAGITDRVYKNSVYSIHNYEEYSIIKKPLYVCCEFATPLKTFKEVFDHNTPHREFYDRHKHEILLQFYLTLQQILKQNKMDSLCELIYYEDNEGKNDIGKILLARIEQQEEELMRLKDD